MSTPSPPIVKTNCRVFPNSIRFYWFTPISSGNSPLSSYTLTCSSISYSQSVPFPVSTLIASPLPSNITYTFQVFATNSNGLAGPPATFIPYQTGVKPDPPSSITASTVTSNALLVNWSTPTFIGGSALTYYALWAYPIDAQSNIVSNTTSSVKYYAYGNDNSYLMYFDNNFINYKLTVRSINSPGWSTDSPANYIPIQFTIPVITSNLIIRFDATTYSGSGTWSNTGSLGTNFNATVETGIPSKNAAGNGIVLNGSTNFNFSNITLGNAFTASVWIKPTSLPFLPAAGWLTQLGSGGAINLMIYGNFTSVGGNAGPNQVSGGFYNGATFTNATALTVSSNIWYHLTYTWNGSVLVSYVSGTSNASRTSANTASGTAFRYRIGRSYDPNSSSYVTGEIGQVLIYNRALSASEVLQNYRSSYNLYR
jgi:hypothetical protein